MTFPTEADILKLKKQEQAHKKEPPFHPAVGLLLLALLAAAGGALAWGVVTRDRAPLIAYVPVTAIPIGSPTATWQPTPTLQPTSPALTAWNLLPALTETAVPGDVASPAAATALPTWTPFPTWTPQPTWTPAPSATPLPTHTPFPTWTPRPTWTPGPAAVALDPAQTRQMELVATWEGAPPDGSGPAVWAYALGVLASTTLLILSLAALFWARHQPPVPVQLLGPPTPIVDVTPLPTSGGGAWRLPPPTERPLREADAPVRTGARTGVTGAAPVQEGAAPAQEPVGEPETITIRILPDDPEVDEAVMRAICEVWNGLEKPSLTRVCFDYFGGKNSDRLAIVRRAVEWGRAQGVIEED